MGEESEKKVGRPESVAPRRTIEMRAVDPVTFRMIAKAQIESKRERGHLAWTPTNGGLGYFE